MRLPLFDPPPEPAPVRYGIDSPQYHAWWTNFRRGASGQSAPGHDSNESVDAYAQSGYRVGRLFRPLPCM